MPILKWISASVILALFTCSSIASTSPETIVFSSLRPSNWDIYIFEKPGGPARRLTSDPAMDYNAVFSADGRWVVFCSERRGNPDLYALDLEREAPPRLLTDSQAMEDAPAFSPDGRRLAFVSTRDDNAEIYLMAFDAEKPASLIKAVNLTRNSAGDFNPAFSPDGKKIAFSSERDSPQRFGPPGSKSSDIYVMDADGSNVKRLTSAKGWDGSPAWSADGQTVFFYSDREGKPRIFRMKADGSDQQAVTAVGTKALSPALTRDGRLAFAANIDNLWQIVSTAADGTGQRVESDSQNDYWAPAFDLRSGRMVCQGTGPVESTSKIATSIAIGMKDMVPFLTPGSHRRAELPDRTVGLYGFLSFTSAVNPRTNEVVGLGTLSAADRAPYVIASNLDGTGLREVFKPKGPAWATVWSKDGNWIAFTVGPPFAPAKAQADIWKVKSDGTGAVNLTEGCEANDGFPDFSPDGRRIVFRSGRSGNHEIYLMDSDGGNVRRLTENAATDTMPAFSPAGDLIAFTSFRDEDPEIYTLQINPDGTPGQVRRITNSAGADTHPRFSPDGKWIVFASDRGGNNDEEPLNILGIPQPAGELWAVRLADGLTLRLTHNKWEDGVPTWK
jgi:TolB protein